jgi:hypothetical protein
MLWPLRFGTLEPLRLLGQRMFLLQGSSCRHRTGGGCGPSHLVHMPRHLFRNNGERRRMCRLSLRNSTRVTGLTWMKFGVVGAQWVLVQLGSFFKATART